MLRSTLLSICRPKRVRQLSEAAQGDPVHDARAPAANVLFAPLDRMPNLNPSVKKALSLENASQSEQSSIKTSEIIARFRQCPNDTGSPEVQVAIATDRIKRLTAHLQSHRKDQSTRRGLLQLVQNRRKMLKYLLRKSPERYLSLISNLGLRETVAFSNDIGTLGAKNHPSPGLRRN